MADEKDDVQDRLKELPVKAGQKYRHFKGGEYEVVAIAIKEDTLETLVIYRSLRKGYIWARTFENWNETVTRNNRQMKRFRRIKRDKEALLRIV